MTVCDAYLLITHFRHWDRCSQNSVNWISIQSEDYSSLIYWKKCLNVKNYDIIEKKIM